MPGLVLAGLTLMALLCRCDQTPVATIQVGDTDAPPPVGEPVAPARRISTIRVLLCSESSGGLARIATTGGYELTMDGRVVAQSGSPMPAVNVSCRAGQWRIGSGRFAGRRAVLTPADGAMVRIGGNLYRGSLHLIAGEDDGFQAVNHVGLEHYLAGVLPKELYGNWEAATYEALAVAARTFAMYNCLIASPESDYDVGDNESSQCYGGYSAETDKSRAAVDATRGVVLSHGPPGAERIFLAQYSACCGGRVNGAYVIRHAQRVEPLEGGQVCTDCAGCSRYRWPAVRIRKYDILRALQARYRDAGRLSRLDRIEVLTTTDHGRAVWVDVHGGGSKIRVRAEDIRLSLLSDGPPAARGIYSMNCRMIDRGSVIEFADGRGFGHGVGLCQWGAQAKAARGWTAERILAFYYPGAKLFRVE